MKKSEQVRFVVEHNPGATVNDISDIIGEERRRVSAWCKQMFDRGWLTREVVRHTLTNVPVFGYSLARTERKPPGRPAVISTKDNVVSHERKLKSEGIDALVEQLASAVAQKFAQSLRAKFAEAVRQVYSEFDMPLGNAEVGNSQEAPSVVELLERREEAALPVKARKLAVLVVGLLPQQAGTIQAEFHDVFDLRFWKEGAMGELKRAACACDVAVLFVTKVSHAQGDMLKSHAPRVIYSTGGMTQLKDNLMQLFVETSEKEKA